MSMSTSTSTNASEFNMMDLKSLMLVKSIETGSLWRVNERINMISWGSIVLVARGPDFDLTIATSGQPKIYEHARFMLQCLIELQGGKATFKTRGMAKQALILLEAGGYKVTEHKAAAIFNGKVKVFSDTIEVEAPSAA